MGKIENWNFADEKLNSSQPLINRQKSALNIKIISINQIDKRAVLCDIDNGTVNTTLEICECNDFNFVGGYPRKKFQPCMHIYKLAIELGLMEISHIGYKTKMRMMTTEERKEFDNNEMRLLDSDPLQWGSWNEKIHKNSQQRDRQIRAHEINDGKQIVNKDKQTGEINCYQTALNFCTCFDFEARKLPCKHIYCLAILLGIGIKVTEEDFKNYKQQFSENFQPLISISHKNNEFKIIDHTDGGGI